MFLHDEYYGNKYVINVSFIDNFTPLWYGAQENCLDFTSRINVLTFYYFVLQVLLDLSSPYLNTKWPQLTKWCLSDNRNMRAFLYTLWSYYLILSKYYEALFLFLISKNVMKINFSRILVFTNFNQKCIVYFIIFYLFTLRIRFILYFWKFRPQWWNRIFHYFSPNYFLVMGNFCV